MITDAELIDFEARGWIHDRDAGIDYYEVERPILDAILARLRAAEAVVAWYADSDRYYYEDFQEGDRSYHSASQTEIDEGERARAHLAAVRGDGV